jgi:hypothetical protein
MQRVERRGVGTFAAPLLKEPEGGEHALQIVRSADEGQLELRPVQQQHVDGLHPQVLMRPREQLLQARHRLWVRVRVGVRVRVRVS